MPRHPRISPSVEATRGSVFSSLAGRVKAYEGETFPLHVGDTWMEPAAGCRMEDLKVAEHPGMHRYASPQGLPELLEILAEQVRDRTGEATGKDDVLVAAGATGALGAVVGAIMAPGEEVLILAPYWPLIAGIVRSFHGTPVPVPFLDRVASVAEALEAVEAQRTDRTVALYLNSPNNPTGRVLPRAWLEALADWCRSNDLWLMADEVYEHYCYVGEHTYTRPLAPERTFSVHSFSKAYGMAGNRCGYVVGPGGVMPDLRKVSLHTFYSTPTASQLAALHVLEGPGEAWVSQAREKYLDLGRLRRSPAGRRRPGRGHVSLPGRLRGTRRPGTHGLSRGLRGQGPLSRPRPELRPLPKARAALLHLRRARHRPSRRRGSGGGPRTLDERGPATRRPVSEAHLFDFTRGGESGRMTPGRREGSEGPVQGVSPLAPDEPGRPARGRGDREAVERHLQSETQRLDVGLLQRPAAEELRDSGRGGQGLQVVRLLGCEESSGETRHFDLLIDALDVHAHFPSRGDGDQGEVV